jgi:hypothetical protein
VRGRSCTKAVQVVLPHAVHSICPACEAAAACRVGRVPRGALRRMTRPRAARRRAGATALAAALAGACAGAAAAAPFACLAARSAATCAALGALYDATGGPGWSNFTGGWQAASSGSGGADYCAFDGVRCDASFDVTSLCVCRMPPCGAAAAALRARVAQWCLLAWLTLYAHCVFTRSFSLVRRSALRSSLLVGVLPASLGALSRLRSLCVPAPRGPRRALAAAALNHKTADARTAACPTQRPGRQPAVRPAARGAGQPDVAHHAATGRQLPVGLAGSAGAAAGVNHAVRIFASASASARHARCAAAAARR